jgi:hypothetical protein
VANADDVARTLRLFVKSRDATVGDQLVGMLSDMVPTVARRYHDRGVADELIDKTTHAALREAVFATESDDWKLLETAIHRMMVRRLRECFAKEGFSVRMSPSGRLVNPPS